MTLQHHNKGLGELLNTVPNITTAVLTEPEDIDIQELSEAVLTLNANQNDFNIGGYYQSLSLNELIAHFRGAILVPDILLIIGRYDGSIGGAIQLITTLNNKSFAFSARLKHHFVVSWARGHGISRYLLEEAENQAKVRGIQSLTTSIRADRQEVIDLYENYGYTRWGTLEHYEMLPNKIILPGHFYVKTFEK
jgi:ribosomal protein S18 acetylase RimI-like enzyme